MAFASVKTADFVLETGEEALGRVASSNFGHRRFCTRCGTPIYMAVDHQPETVDFSIATLDEPETVTPGFHIFYGSRIGWAQPADDLPRYERFRPDTRGLDGTEPPL
jgi:hypothetical protein